MSSVRLEVQFAGSSLVPATKVAISAVIPALQEERTITATVGAIFAIDGVGEVIVVDGGSQIGHTITRKWRERR